LAKSLLEWVRENRPSDLGVYQPNNIVWNEDKEKILIEGHNNLDIQEDIMKRLGWEFTNYNRKRLWLKLHSLLMKNKIRPRYLIIMDKFNMDLEEKNFENLVLTYRDELEAINNGDYSSNQFTKSMMANLSKKRKFVFRHVLSEKTLSILNRCSEGKY
jgi:membrane-anchored glycerophosphoryl diester phosphodiesterase (GDPDase)